MNPQTQSGAESSLCAGILSEARRQADEVLHRAGQEAGALTAQAEVKAAQLVREARGAANLQAGQHRQRILAALPAEISQERRLAMESVLEAIQQRALQRLLEKQGYDYEASIIRLTSEALTQMVGEEFQLLIHPADGAAFGTKLASALASTSNVSKVRILEDPGITGAGFQLNNQAGNQTWDNRFAARLERLWPELRRQLAVWIASRTGMS